MKTFPSKYSGTCKSCKGPIGRGTMIQWSSTLGAYHVNCEITINGKSREELAREWDEEHANDMTSIDRFEAMRVDKDYRYVPEDVLMQYAHQDTQRNPYR